MASKETFKSPFDLFETDESLERDGIRVDYGTFWLQIGRIDKAGTQFAAFMTEKLRPYTRAIQLGEMDNGVAEAITREGFSKYLTYAWGSRQFGDGKMPDKAGKPMDFTPENVEAFYKALPALFEDLLNESKKLVNFRKLRVETDSGN